MNKQYLLILVIVSVVNLGCASKDQYTQTSLCNKTTIFDRGTRLLSSLPDSVAKAAILVLYDTGWYDAGYVFRVNGKCYRTNELGYCEFETNTENCTLITSWVSTCRAGFDANEFIRINNRGRKVDTFSIKLKKKCITYFELIQHVEPTLD